MENWGLKLTSAKVEVEVEVEAELGKIMKMKYVIKKADYSSVMKLITKFLH